MVIADETDEAAFARWDALNAAVDREAIATMTGRAATDGSDERSHTRQLALPEGAINFNIGTLVGSYESVAAMLDEAADVPGTKGIMLDLRRLPAGPGGLRRSHPAADGVAPRASIAA